MRWITLGLMFRMQAGFMSVTVSAYTAPVEHRTRPLPGDPVLETDRLVVRAYSADHFAAFFEMVADPLTFRFSERGSMNSEEAWTRLLRNVGHCSLAGYGVFAIEEKTGGRYVGEAGFGDFRRRLGPKFDPHPEGAWSIARWAQGRGYATEAAGAVLCWLEEGFGVEQTVCLIHADNEASLCVAEKLGYRRMREREYRGYSAVQMERRRGG